MHRKLFTLITALLLVLTTSVAPMKVAAKGNVEYIILMVGIGPNEALESYYLVREVPPDNANYPGGVQGTVQPFTISVSNAGPSVAHGNGTCLDTVQAPVALIAGLNVLTVTRASNVLSINGEKVDLDNCFDNEDVKRVVLTLRVSPFKDGQGPVVPPAEPQGILLNEVWGYSIVNLTTYETVASSNLGKVIPKLEIHSTATY